ncbi:nudix-type nucleoside diphosphatase, YffH/AdpP family [Salinihabitans flavidus]|uniref:Putative gamma-glutamylcyclotransferase n=1 Tax=Salinihabitans flavidus TaxID=569882 RepID=A0A1H8TE76_9RHOB|nr:gamma-glutamylcyclotransferase [Salinihabitans flavidus]SEO88894.1 nudix-type nucleoside diphosphatase, YffH/AdpP family [Salinihabitans flavidus]
MDTLFFYGTLRYRPLLEIVLGRGAKTVAAQPATLHGYAVVRDGSSPFPTIRAEPGARAEGLVVEGLSENDRARLDFYEGGFAYALRPVTVHGEDGPQVAEVYFPDTEERPRGADWSFEEWAARWAEMSCHAAREVMGYYEVRSAQEVAAIFPAIRARAWAKVRARAQNHAYSPSGYTDSDVRECAHRQPYGGFYALAEYDLCYRRYDGSMSEQVERAVLVATDAVIVLPYDPARDRVLLIEQFRPGPHARNDARPWQLEPVAGRIDAGETPEATARRETVEEAGIELRGLEEVAHAYATPGCSSEFFDIYVGLTDLPDDVTGVAGLDSEAEDIRSYLFGFDEAMALVDRMAIVNAPLLVALLWLARHRERLRVAA